MAGKIVITCALTGGLPGAPAKNPAVPVTPAQLAQSALEAARAGAAIVHIHVRDPKTTDPSMDLDLYRETVERIREKDGEVVINLTTGAGAFVQFSPQEPTKPIGITSPDERVRHIEVLRPEICSLDVGSLNFGEHLALHLLPHMREIARRAKAVGVKPEIEVFDLGHIEQAKQLISEGVIEPPYLFQICLGVPYGAPATSDTMAAMRDRLPPDSNWASFGISRQQFPMVAAAAELGGHVRVGLEDNLYIARGELAASNAALVDKAVKLLHMLGYDVATPQEARDIFKLRPTA